MTTHEEAAFFEANKKLWNAKTPIHIDAEFYDLPGFKRGESSLRSVEVEELGDVAGKSMLHLQCHFGMDTLSWARKGARVTGIDLSDKAIEQANNLANELDIPAQFVCSNLYDLKSNLEGQYDIIFTSYGTIGWLPDLDKWADIINHFLKPGGTFYMVDFHPVIWMYNPKMTKIVDSYFNQGVIHEVLEGTYADRNSSIKLDEYGWNHPISDILTALLSQGLQLEIFHEFPFSTWNCFANLKEIGKHKYVFKDLEGMVPYMYSLKMNK